MKNSNLLNRLLSYSHEKQSPQRFARYAAVLMMLLTLGVGQMWATDYYLMKTDGTGKGTSQGKMTVSGGVASIEWNAASNPSGSKFYVATAITGNKDVDYLCGSLTFNESEQQLYLYGTSNYGDAVTLSCTQTGKYRFEFNTSTNKIRCFYPKTLLKPGKYIYFDARDESNWKESNFAARFWFKYYDSNSDAANVWCAKANALENWVYYAEVPSNNYIGKIQMNRYSAVDGTYWNNSAITTASGRSSITQNCIKAPSSGWDNISLTWTTYAPPLSSVSLSDNGTAILAGGGTELNPYLIATGATIKVIASGTKAVADPDATIWYNIKDNTTSKQNSSTATYSFTASATANTVYQMKVDGYTKVSSTSSTELTSDIIYYKTVSVKNISVYIYVGGCTSDQINSIELFGTPYVGSVALDAVHKYIGDFTTDGDWRKYTFTNVSEVQSLVVARSGGRAVDDITATADVYAKWDGTALDGKCVPRANPTWGTAPVSGAIGGSMTATVSGAPDGATITWSSTDGDVATVNSSGVISYVAAGNTTIKANVSWDASGDYCSGSYELSQAITVTSGATVSVTRTCPAYVSTGAGEVTLDITSTGASSGWYYRIKNKSTGGYYAPDNQSAASNALSWTMSGGIGAELTTLVVELYNGSNTLICTSSDVTVTGETAHITYIAAGSNGSVSPTTVYANNSNVHPSITATPNSHYHFVEWTSDNAAASVASTTSATTTVTATAGGYTITASFAGDEYTISYYDQGGGAFSGTQASAPTTHTYGTATTLKIPTKTGYAFGGWYTASDCASGAVGDANSASLGATDYTGNITLYAKWTEVMSDLTTSCNYDAGDPSYSAPTVSNLATTVGYTTTRTITAPAAGTGYTFVGWTLTNCTRTDGGGATTNPITIRSNGDGEDVSVVANYEEDLSTTFYIAGATSARSPFSGWGASGISMSKKSGYATTEIYYCTVHVTNVAGDGEFEFKPYNSVGNVHYGHDNYWVTRENHADIPCWGDNDKSLWFKPDIAGDYEFKIDNTGTYPELTVTFPTTYTVNFGVSPAAAADAPTNDLSISSGSSVLSGTEITFTQDPTPNPGYTWSHWEKNSSNVGTGDNYTTTIDAATTVTAVYTENSYSTNVAVSPASSGSISSPTPSDGKINVLHHTGTSVTASPNTNYIFDYWSVADGGLTIVGEADANPATFKATEDYGTITAHFADQWAIGIFGGSTTWKGLPLKSGTVYEESYELAKGNHAFKVVDRKENVYYAVGSSAVDVDRDHNTKTASYEGGTGNDMTLKADVAGTYTFTFNTSSKALKIGFPEAYAVTYSAVRFNGSGTAWSGAPSAQTSASLAVTSGDMVLDGSTVTFTAQAANEGFTWRGWFTKSNPSTWSDGKVSEGDELTYTTTLEDAAVTVYAIYTEDMHTVTVTVDSHGTITTPASGTPRTVQAGISTSASIAASAVYGYYFKDWTVESGTASFGNKDAASTTVNATEDATILANFVSHWTIAGGDTDEADGPDAMGDWSTLANSIEHFEEIETKVWQGYVDIDLPANSTFKFKVRDLYDGSAWYGNTGTMTYGNHTDWSMTTDAGKNCGITTAGKGSYRFTWNETNKTLTVVYPTSWTVAYGVKTSYNGGATSDATTTGGSITSVKDGDNIDLVSGKYVVGGGSVTVVAAPASGYEIAGWYSDAACTSAYTSGEGGVTISGEGNTNFTITGLAANTGIYVKFAEKMTTVNFASTHGHVKISGVTETSANVGVHTTYNDLTAVPDWGYYFAGWEKTAGDDYSITADEDDEDDNVNTLAGLGGGATSGQTLTAKFVELDKVYLYNLGWGERLDDLWPTDGDNHIYAYFAVQEESSCPKSANTDDPYYIQQMAQEDIVTMYAYVPRAVTRNLNAGTYGDNERIAFSNHQFAKNYKFYEYEAIYWGSYRQILNEFIPQVNDYKTLNSTKVYNGYWKKHDPKIGDEAGYYLKHRTGDNTYGDFTNGTDPIFKYISDNMIQCKLRIDNSDDINNYYMIHSAGGVKYTTAESPQDAEAPTVTSSNCLNVGITENQINDSKFLIKQTSQGYYTLTMTFSSDTMYLKVDYPVAVGDYRLEHAYTIDEETKKTRSGIIKSDADLKYTSMYINMEADTKSLKFQKCTEIDGDGYPVWSTGVDVDGLTTDNFNQGNGVYVFKAEWDNEGRTVTQDVISATVSNASPYDGEYYIKTDYALGGWTNYIMNDMEKNTINFNKNNPKTFDYYYAAWVSSETGDRNVKCVVGNIYNEALCDTLVGDEILGEVWDATEGKNVPRQYLAYDASVRFSYNSYTNELKRAYLNGSNDGETDYMYLQGTSESTSQILDYSTEAAFPGNTVKFKDRGNWIYEIDIKAEEGARVKLISNYRFSDADHLQYLKGSDGEWGTSTTSQILGGSNYTTSHPIRIVYDFKTNHLISAWLAEGETSSRAINTNAMIIREHQEQANQITFGEDDETKKLSSVDTLYSVMKFNKWTLNNKDKSTHDLLASPKSQYERDLFWISFPYDVKLSDVFGFGNYMQHWAIMYYDGRNRAKNGYWLEDKTNWKFIPANKRDTILHAFEGYVLALDLDLLGESSKVFELVEDIYLYFPSNGPAGSIVQQDTTIAIDTVGYHCNIDRYHKNDGSGGTTGLPASYDRRYRDSHWHCIGVPSFHDVSHGIVQNSGEGDQPWVDGDGDEEVDMPNPNKYTLAQWETLDVPYFYEWNMESNELEPQSSDGSYTFQSMYAYLVQYANDHITWSAVTISPKPKSIVERRKARLADDHFSEFNLHLMREDKSLDHTYVRLTDNEGATTAFEFNQDMCKEFISGANIYTLIDELEVAGNSLPLSEQTTIVPVGVKIASNGIYTFSMPEGTEGIGVVLVDNITGTRTNLGLTDYEVSLTAGKIDNRFWLEISPISQVQTGIEPISGGNDDEVRKVIVDQQMYIIRNNEIFDAQGRQVK